MSHDPKQQQSLEREAGAGEGKTSLRRYDHPGPFGWLLRPQALDVVLGSEDAKRNRPGPCCRVPLAPGARLPTGWYNVGPQGKSVDPTVASGEDGPE